MLALFLIFFPLTPWTEISELAAVFRSDDGWWFDAWFLADGDGKGGDEGLS